PGCTMQPAVSECTRVSRSGQGETTAPARDGRGPAARELERQVPDPNGDRGGRTERETSTPRPRRWPARRWHGGCPPSPLQAAPPGQGRDSASRAVTVERR